MPEDGRAREAEVDVDVVERDRPAARTPDGRHVERAGHRGDQRHGPQVPEQGLAQSADGGRPLHRASLDRTHRVRYIERMSDERDPVDERRWEAVEEATELLVDRQWEPALELLRDVIKTDPMNPYAYHYVGTALYELGKIEPAKDAFEAAVKLAPEYRGARIGLAHVLRRLGRAEEAIVEAREVLDSFPDDGEAMHALGLALAARGDKQRSRRALEAY